MWKTFHLFFCQAGQNILRAGKNVLLTHQIRPTLDGCDRLDQLYHNQTGLYYTIFSQLFYIFIAFFLQSRYFIVYLTLRRDWSPTFLVTNDDICLCSLVTNHYLPTWSPHNYFFLAVLPNAGNQWTKLIILAASETIDISQKINPLCFS